MRIFFRTIIAVATITFVFIVLNWPYFKLHGQHYLFPPKSEDIQKQAEFHPGPNRIVIRNLSIDAPIVYIQEDTEEAFQSALQRGVVHFTGTPTVGEVGNAYYFGHSSDLITSPGEFKNVFALLPQIQVGDYIEVTDNVGRLYKYQAQKTYVVAADDLSVLNQDTEKHILTLQTSYPLGTALRRFIVVSELAE